MLLSLLRGPSAHLAFYVYSNNDLLTIRQVMGSSSYGRSDHDVDILGLEISDASTRLDARTRSICRTSSPNWRAGSWAGFHTLREAWVAYKCKICLAIRLGRIFIHIVQAAWCTSHMLTGGILIDTQYLPWYSTASGWVQHLCPSLLTSLSSRSILVQHRSGFCSFPVHPLLRSKGSRRRRIRAARSCDRHL